MGGRTVLHRTVEDVDIIKDNGFSGLPYGSSDSVSACEYMVLCQDQRTARAQHGKWSHATANPVAHRAAFALLRVASVDYDDDEGHLRTHTREIARLPQIMPSLFPEQRGSLSFNDRNGAPWTLQKLGIPDPATLQWEPVAPPPTPQPAPSAPEIENTESAPTPPCLTVQQAVDFLTGAGFEVTLRAAPTYP